MEEVRNIKLKKEDNKKEAHIPFEKVTEEDSKLLEKTVHMLMSESICPIF